MTVTALGVPTVLPNPEDAPAGGPLVDNYGRIATDLRVSLTDRCNLRCIYCMPAEGLDWLPTDQLLRPGEFNRLIRLAVARMGVTSVRFTGGEPLVSKHLERIVATTARTRPRPDIALTTNGAGLARRAERLKQVGLDRINVSLDSVDPGRFAAITRRDRLADVLGVLRRHFTLRPDPAPRGSSPAQLWQVDGGPATVGMIASVSHASCAACDRTRITADGQVRSCLFVTQETDLRSLLRDGADDDAIEAAWRAAMWGKPAGHGINDPHFIQPARPMSAIGG